MTSLLGRGVQIAFLITIPFLVGLWTSYKLLLPTDWIAAYSSSSSSSSSSSFGTTTTTNTSIGSGSGSGITTDDEGGSDVITTSSSSDKNKKQDGRSSGRPTEVVGNTGFMRELEQYAEGGGGSAFGGDTKIALHLNGDSGHCALSLDEANIMEVIRSKASDYTGPMDTFTKYDLDALITETLLEVITDGSCGGTTSRGDDDDSSSSGWSFLDYCDMGEEKTVVLPDHDQLIAIDGRSRNDDNDEEDDEELFYPCHYHTREGLRITTLRQFFDLARKTTSSAATAAGGEATAMKQECVVDDESGESVCTTSPSSSEKTPLSLLHLYAVPAGRLFIFAPSYVGERFDLSYHVDSDVGDGDVELEVLSVSPRVFEVHNFFSKKESDDIVHTALSETSDSHKMKRSSTGASGYHVNSKRTSENAFVTHTETAMKVKQRCFSVLGFDEYHESIADGLQVLRYNKTTAYVDHMDWIDDVSRREEHDYNSQGVGTNRFATILLYMSDLPEEGGGETVFVHGWPGDAVEEEQRLNLPTALSKVRDEGLVDMFKRGSWEEKLVAQCRSRLAVKPAHAKAVLFYSQNPDGTPDNMSLHGGCPVLEGEKYAANLWVWNGIRAGYDGAPVNQAVVEQNRKKNTGDTNAAAVPSSHRQLQASFQNSGTNEQYAKAELYYEDTFWGKLGHGDPPLNVNTFMGHRWYVKVDGNRVKSFTITGDDNQVYTL